MSINSLTKPTMAQRLARDYWRAFKSDGGLVVSSAGLPAGSAGASHHSLGGGSAESGMIQIAAIRECPQLKLSLLRHRKHWASDSDNDDDGDRDRDDDNDDDRDDDNDDDRDDDDDRDESQIVIRGTPLLYGKVIIQDDTPTLFKPGSFAAHLATKPDVAVLAHLDLAAILGRSKSGTAVFSEDALGLHFCCLPPATTFANDLLVSIFRKDVLGCAAAIVPQKQNWEMRGGQRIRVVEAARLIMAAVVSFGDDADSIRVTQSNDLPDDDDDDLDLAAHHQQLNDKDHSLLHDMGIESSSSSGRGPSILVRRSERCRRAVLALEEAHAASLDENGLREYTPLSPKGRQY